MPTLAGLLGKGGNIAEQMFIWGVLQGLVSGAVAPASAELQQLAYKVAPNVPIDPGDVARMVARNLRDQANGAEEAELSGTSGDRFNYLTEDAYTGPGVPTAIDAYNRGLIGEGSGDPKEASLTGAMADAGLRPPWHDILAKMTYQVPSWQNALNADLEGQLSRADAQEWYRKGGGDPDAYQWLYDTTGQAPTPSEALVMANRGIIPWDGTGPQSVAYEQAFLEGPWRNKWEKPFRALGVYLPPPRTVTAMYKEGSLSHDEAVKLLTMTGLAPDLAAAYVQDGNKQAAASSKNLTESAVINLYEARVLAQSDTQAMLETLGYSPDNATYIIKLADLRRAIAAVNTAVSRVQTLFVGHKIDAALAQSALNALAVPADQVAEIIQIWTLEASVNVATLTESQIGQAYSAKIITQDEAMAELEHIGYTPLDAWTLLSIRAKTPLPDKPGAGPSPVQALPTVKGAP